MSLLIPIQPEPASRIREGIKWFELRKMRPPETGLIYLYETEDRTASVFRIRTVINTDQYLELPLEDLWNRVGGFATSRPKFESYFGGNYRYGIAIPILETRHLAEEVSIADLQNVDPDFKLPDRHWTYYRIDDSSAVGRHLASIPVGKVIVPPPEALATESISDLRVSRLAGDIEARLFAEMYRTFVKPYYPDCEDYEETILQSYHSLRDPYGYLTIRKDLWTFRLRDEVVGFTVATVKRGGSVKFGPTVILPPHRGLRLGANFRLLVEREYPDARKFYNTLPADNAPALQYVLNAGYRIEAHLVQHYDRNRDEIVVGKIVDATGSARDCTPEIYHRGIPEDELHIVTAGDLDQGVAAEIIESLLRNVYSEIDAGFVEAVMLGRLQPRSDLSRKPKEVLIAFRGTKAVGCMVTSPKRGGLLKCSPVVVINGDQKAFGALVRNAISMFRSEEHHKIYLHIPVLESALIRESFDLGFEIEGTLRAPYTPGLDMLAMGRVEQ